MWSKKDKNVTRGRGGGSEKSYHIISTLMLSLLKMLLVSDQEYRGRIISQTGNELALS